MTMRFKLTPTPDGGTVLKTAPPVPTSSPITDPEAVLKFVLGGNATFTMVSLKTGKRYTFRVRKDKDAEDRFYVSTLTGPNNSDDFEYLGYINEPTMRHGLRAGRRGDANDVRFRGVSYLVANLATGRMPDDVEFWHEGRCGRCNRKLTDPVSIERGLGPECAGKA